MRKSKLRTVITLITIVVLLASFSIIRLMQFQIVDAEEYIDQVNRRTVSEVSVSAARGDIVDRNGNLIATNKAGFNIVFDRAFLPEGKENETILELTKLLSENGAVWIDNLPLSTTYPYYFEQGRDEDIEKMKSRLGLQTYATAEECMAEMVEKFELTGMTREEVRTVAAVRYEMFAKEFSIYNRYTFAEDVPVSVVAKIEEESDKYQGVSVSEEATRVYTDGTLLPHLIGDVGPIYAENYQQYKDKGYDMDDIVGNSGIEKSMEEYLRGEDGAITVEQNTKGEVLSTTQTKDPVSGDTVVLTIDSSLQKVAQQSLEDHIALLRSGRANGRGTDAKTGAVAVLDVKTGEILAAVNSPSYDSNLLKTQPGYYNQLVSDPLKPMVNRVFTGLYRPGSTFKTITATAALTEGIINQNSTVTCRRVYTYWDDYQPKCTGTHGTISVVEALQKSCNIFFYDVGRLLGIDALDRYAAYYGVGEDCGLEEGISRGYGAMSSPAYSQSLGENWEAGHTVQAAIGQQNTTLTPLQLANQAATIANKGVRYETHLIKEVTSYDGSEVVQRTDPVVANDEMTGHDDVFDIVTQGMIAAGANPSQKLNDLGVAIKTGTPQTNPAGTRQNSVVIGFYPAENPEIAFSVVVEDGEYASWVMRPIIEAYNQLKAGTYGQSSGTQQNEQDSQG